MSDAFTEAFDRTVGLEGRYSDDPADSGGATKYGITIALARAHGYAGAMVSMSLGVAQEIYRDQFWNLLRLDDVASASRAIALEVFDAAVNCGSAAVATWLQRALNALNRNGTDYRDVAADGVLGPMTVFALRAFLALRGNEGETVLLRALNSLQGAYYIGLAERREKDERFVYGWLRNRVVIA